MIMFIHKRIQLDTTCLKVIAKSAGRDRAEKVYLDRLRARNDAAKIKSNNRPWHTGGPCRPSHGNPSKLVPQYEWFVSDGCGYIRLSAKVVDRQEGGHNWYCCSRRDVYFYDLTGQAWWGFHIAATWGDRFYSNDSVYCRKLKKEPWFIPERFRYDPMFAEP